MGIEIKTRTLSEVQQIKSRELQLENVEKLNELSSIVETIDEVDLQGIESNTSDIKDMIVTNLDEQVDLDKLQKDIIELKKNVTRLSNIVKDGFEKIDKVLTKLEDEND